MHMKMIIKSHTLLAEPFNPFRHILLIATQEKCFCALLFRPKGGQVSPQNTEVTQFVSSDIDIQADQNAQSSSAAILQGRQGTPAGKLPPIKSAVRSHFECNTVTTGRSWNTIRVTTLFRSTIVAKTC